MLQAVLHAIRALIGRTGLYNAIVKLFITATESGYIPDFALRYGIRYLLAARAAEVSNGLPWPLHSPPALAS